MKRSVLIICLTLLFSHVHAQSNQPEVITPENIHNLAIVARLSPESFGLDDARITHYTFHPDNGNLIVAMQTWSGGRTALIGIYDPINAEIITILEDDTFHSTGNWISNIVFSPDRSLLVSIDDRWGFIVWDMQEEEVLFIGDSAGIPIITHDNRLLIIYSAGVVHIWDIELQREVDRRQLNCPGIYGEGTNLICTRLTDGLLYIQVYELPSFELVEESISSVNVDTRLIIRTPDNLRLVHFLGEVYEIIDARTYEIIERAETDFMLGTYVTNNPGTIIAYYIEDNMQFYDPIADVELYSIPMPRYERASRFGFQDTYFAVFSYYDTPIRLYGVSDCSVISDRSINLRTGPGTEFDNPETIESGERLAVDGQIQVGIYTWWHLSIGYWVREDVVIESGGACDDVAVIE